MRIFMLLACVFALCFAPMAQAGETGHYSSGADLFDIGTLPPPGMYMKNYFVHYSANTLRDGSGNKVDSSFKLNANTLVNRFLYVTDMKLFGADVGFHAIVPLNYNKVTNPMGDKGSRAGVGDVYLEPLLLGWHWDRVNVIYGLGVYLPTGRWERNEVSNMGKDFYTFMQSLGMDVALDEAKTWTLGGRFRYEIHTTNRTLNIRHGNDLTFEFELSKKITPVIELGVVGYGQWQVTKDSGGDLYWNKNTKDRVYGVGPELRWVIPSWNSSVSLNYIHEFGAKDHSEGQVFALSLSHAF